ncbi:MAG TPA: baseplate assembly protein, partial [Campylobacterales bacterium]|nr:baseplate assembly protein [Campylobacterales bacterium]
MKLNLSDLPFPTIIEPLDYEAIVARKLARVKEILASKGIEYIESEADDLMTLIEADAYEELLLRANLNERIKQMFLAYATGSNLDHIGITRFGVERLAGVKPKADVEFTLSTTKDTDIIILAGTLIGNGVEIAEVVEDVIIRAGSLSGVGVVELQRECESFDGKLEMFLTPLPFVVKVKQLTAFVGGADAEDDERYRERIWLSRERRTTAGSRAMYEYYAKSSDVRVKEVAIHNGGAGVVDVVVLGENFKTTDEMVKNVLNGLNSEEIRPLTDKVQVQKAKIVDVKIEATLVVK